MHWNGRRLASRIMLKHNASRIERNSAELSYLKISKIVLEALPVANPGVTRIRVSVIIVARGILMTSDLSPGWGCPSI